MGMSEGKFTRLRGRLGYGLVVVGLLLLIGLGVGSAGVWLWGRHHFRAAERALAEHRLPQARQHIQKCLQVWPDSFFAHFLAARAARRALHFKEAEHHLDQCKRLKGKSDLLHRERLLLQVQKGEVDTHEAYFRKLVEEDHPDSALILEAFTEGYLRLYRIPEADYCLWLWEQRQPDNLFIYLFRGWIKERIPNYQEAAAAYRRAVELNPDYDEARLRYANALLETNQVAEAIVHLEHLRRRQPGDPTVLTRLARCRNTMGDSTAARQLLEEVLAAFPGHPPALVLRGQIDLQEGRAEEAERVLRKCLDLAPYDREANYAYYLCLQQLPGKQAEAEAQRVRFQRIEADLKQMHEIVSQKMGAAPHDPALHYEVGLIHLRLGDEREGLTWLQRAVKLDPQYRPAHAALADYYRRVGNVQRAEEHGRLAAVPPQ